MTRQQTVLSVIAVPGLIRQEWAVKLLRVSLLLLLGCDGLAGEIDEAGQFVERDAGNVVVGRVDAGAGNADAGQPDAGAVVSSPDAGMADAGGLESADAGGFEPVDAGGFEPVDAGSVDAGLGPGRPDAGVVAVDAGVVAVDAGRPDAGVPVVDAGRPDAGVSVVDAGRPDAGGRFDAGTIYYVSPLGANTNNGTSLATPVQTITRALSMANAAGDIIYVRGGTYNEVVRVNQNGITLRAYQNENPIIDGRTNLPGADWSAMVELNGNDITLSGFEVINSNYNCSFAGGIGVNSYGHRNTLSQINAHDNCSNGIYVAGDFSVVEDSDVHHNSRVLIAWNGARGWGAGLSSADGSRNGVNPGLSTGNVLRRNRVHENWGEGISCFNTTQCLIEDSVSYNNRAANIYIQNATYSKVQRNLVYITIPHTLSGSVTSEGIVLADERTDKPLSSHNVVINNFSYNADMAAFDWTLVNSGLNNDVIANNTIVNAVLKVNYVPAPPPPGWATITHVNTEIRNNIVFGNRRDGIKNVPSGVVFSNNNYSGSGTVYGTSPSDVIGDPLLARTGSTAPGALTGDYFKVQNGSPVLNAGVGLAVVRDDFFGTPRTSPPDIGGHQLP